MKIEFRRYKAERLRVFTGTSQLLGSLGLIIGYWIPSVGIGAASGFCVMMIGALVVRARIKDKWFAAIPAFLLLIVNFLIVVCMVKLEVR